MFENGCFNSIKVRLKACRVILRQTVLNQFQFHKGAIKRDGDELEYAFLDEFQFHKGAIKRCCCAVVGVAVFVVSIP